MAAILSVDDEHAAIAAAAPGALVTLASDGTILTANPAACRLFARTAGELEGSHWHEWLPRETAAHTRTCIERLLIAADARGPEAIADLDVVTADGIARAVTMAANDYWHGDQRRLVLSLLPRTAMAANSEFMPDEAHANAVLVDKSAIGMTLTDLHGRWLRVNDAFAEMLGYSVDELMRLRFTDITHPDDRAQDTTAVARLKAGEISAFSHEKRYRRRDGSTFWVHIHVNGVTESGALTCWASQIINIDAEYRALEENRALQLRLQSFVDHVPANIAMKDRDGIYTLVNENFAASLKRDPAALIGNTLPKLGIKHPAVAAAEEDDALVLETGHIVEREVPNLIEPGSTYWVTRFPILGPDGSIAGTGLISTEISETKRNEQELLAQARTIGLLQRVAVAANEAHDSHAAMRACLQLVAQYMEWPYGHVSQPNAAGDRLESTGIWIAPQDDIDANGIYDVLAAISRKPGESAIGRARTNRAPADDEGLDRPLVLQQWGIGGAVAFPVELDGALVAMFEFYSPGPVVLDDKARELLEFVSVQVGYAIHREMAERKAAHALEQLSYHINNSAVGVVRVNSEFRVADWSPECQEIFGWTADEVVGKTVEEIGLVHPDDAYLVADAFAMLEDPTVTSYRLFHRNMTKSGNVVHVDWYNSVMRDGTGAVVSNLGIAVDRSVEVEAQRALEEERRIFVSGPTLIMRWRDEPGWPVEYASPNVASIVGYTAEAFYRGEVHLADLIHPDDVSALAQGVETLTDGPGPQWTPEPYRVITKSGEIIWLQTYMSALRDFDATKRYIAYSVDMTPTIALQAETMRQEGRLRNVIAATDVGTWEWDVESDDLRFNERMASMLGYTLEELQPLTFERWKKIIHPDDFSRVIGCVQDNLKGITENTVSDCRLRHKDQEWVWVLVRANVVERDHDGTPLRVAGIHLDISEQKAAEATILETNEALKSSNIELERFAYVASHDLQEPLRMVASFTQLLKNKYSDELDDTAKEYIHFAFDGAQRMQQLIRDLLSYSRLGRQVVEENPVDLAALVARVRQSLQFATEEAGAQVDQAELPIVRGDAGQLSQLLQNLIGNAIKYHGDNSPLIKVYSESRDGETIFCVRDNGIGIDPEQSARVFEIFQRLHSRSDYPGTGIGLSVCKRIVVRHGGRIWFEPAEHGGTVFCFTLAPDRYAVTASDIADD